MIQRMKINDRYKGIFYIILAAFGFAFMNLFVKLAGDLPAIEKSFFRNLMAIFFAFLAMKKGKIPFSIPKGSGSISSSALFWNDRDLCKLLCDWEIVYCGCINA